MPRQKKPKRTTATNHNLYVGAKVRKTAGVMAGQEGEVMSFSADRVQVKYPGYPKYKTILIDRLELLSPPLPVPTGSMDPILEDLNELLKKMYPISKTPAAATTTYSGSSNKITFSPNTNTTSSGNSTSIYNSSNTSATFKGIPLNPFISTLEEIEKEEQSRSVQVHKDTDLVEPEGLILLRKRKSSWVL